MKDLRQFCKKCGMEFNPENTGVNINNIRFCRNCDRVKAYKYQRTPTGKAVKMWSDIKRRAENFSGKYPSYSKRKILLSREEFMKWVVPRLENWLKEHGSLTDASIDRINNNGSYRLQNLQLLTKSENSKKPKQKTYKIRLTK